MNQPSASQQNPILGRARRKAAGCRDRSRAMREGGGGGSRLARSRELPKQPGGSWSGFECWLGGPP